MCARETTWCVYEALSSFTYQSQLFVAGSTFFSLFTGMPCSLIAAICSLTCPLRSEVCGAFPQVHGMHQLSKVRDQLVKEISTRARECSFDGGGPPVPCTHQEQPAGLGFLGRTASQHAHFDARSCPPRSPASPPCSTLSLRNCRRLTAGYVPPRCAAAWRKGVFLLTAN